MLNNVSKMLLELAMYNNPDWQPAFKAVMDAKNNTDAATTVIEKLLHTAAN